MTLAVQTGAFAAPAASDASTPRTGCWGGQFEDDATASAKAVRWKRRLMKEGWGALAGSSVGVFHLTVGMAPRSGRLRHLPFAILCVTTTF